MSIPKDTSRANAAQPDKPLLIPALDVLLHAARESFDAQTLRRLAHRFDEMAAEKEAEG